MFSKRDSERRLATGLFDRRALGRAMIRNDLDSVLALPFIGQVCAQAAHTTHPTTSRRARERDTRAARPASAWRCVDDTLRLGMRRRAGSESVRVREGCQTRRMRPPKSPADPARRDTDAHRKAAGAKRHTRRKRRKECGWSTLCWRPATSCPGVGSFSLMRRRRGRGWCSGGGGGGPPPLSHPDTLASRLSRHAREQV